jgi:hypothetical protein
MPTLDPILIHVDGSHRLEQEPGKNGRNPALNNPALIGIGIAAALTGIVIASALIGIVASPLIGILARIAGIVGIVGSALNAR